ncbi:MAG: hypothetical protein JXQ89_14560 [Pelagimonas sp.]
MARVVPVSFLPWLTTLYLTGLVGVAMFALAQSLQPSADVHAQQTPILNLGSLLPGEPQTRRYKGSAIVFLRLTDAQIETIRTSGPTSALTDPVARNRNLAPDAPATLENRTVDWNGPVFVFDGRCDSFQPMPLYDAGYRSGWFCMRNAAHFDILGRYHKGMALQNLAIPRFEVDETGGVYLTEDPPRITQVQLDRILYGK